MSALKQVCSVTSLSPFFCFASPSLSLSLSLPPPSSLFSPPSSFSPPSLFHSPLSLLLLLSQCSQAPDSHTHTHILPRVKGRARSRIVVRDYRAIIAHFRDKNMRHFCTYTRILAESALRFTTNSAWTR